MKEIRIACETKLYLSLKDLHPIQGSLKEMTKSSAKKLTKSILEDGIDFAFHVWRHPKKGMWYIVDGHGRDALLTYLVEKQGWKCPDVPCVETFAKSLRDARKKVLRSSSTYHKITSEGLYEYVEKYGFTDDIDGYDLPDLDIKKWKENYYGDEVPSERSFKHCPHCGKKIKAKKGKIKTAGEKV